MTGMTLVRLQPKAGAREIKLPTGHARFMTMRTRGRTLWVSGVMSVATVVQLVANLHG